MVIDLSRITPTKKLRSKKLVKKYNILGNKIASYYNTLFILFISKNIKMHEERL